MNLSLILNILNFVLGGFATTLGWLFATLMSAVLIITLPYTRSCWEICKMSLVPFGNDLIHVKYLEPKSAVEIPSDRCSMSSGLSFSVGGCFLPMFFVAFLNV